MHKKAAAFRKDIGKRPAGAPAITCFGWWIRPYKQRPPERAAFDDRAAQRGTRANQHRISVAGSVINASQSHPIQR